MTKRSIGVSMVATGLTFGLLVELGWVLQVWMIAAVGILVLDYARRAAR